MVRFWPFNELDLTFCVSATVQSFIKNRHRQTRVISVPCYAIALGQTNVNQSINTRICIAQNKQSMSSNALSVTALKQTSFQFCAESVWAHSSSTQFCRQSVPRRRAAHSERVTTKNSSRPLTVQGATDRGTQLSSPVQRWYRYTVAAEVDWCSIVQALVQWQLIRDTLADR